MMYRGELLEPEHHSLDAELRQVLRELASFPDPIPAQADF